MLIAEDLLLLLTDKDTGKLAAPGAQVDVALGGALLVELTLMQRIDVAGPGDRVREGRLVVRDAGPIGDTLLDDALGTVRGKEGKKPQAAVNALGKRTRARLYERLSQAGMLKAQGTKLFGLIPRHRWTAEDAEYEAALNDRLATSLRSGVAADDRNGALVSLLLALKAVHKVVDPDSIGLSKRDMNANAKQIAEGEWAAKAVRSAIDSMNAAIIAAATAAAAAGAAASGS